MAVNQYAYADSMYRRIVIAETDLHLRGTYSGTTTYVPLDAAVYGDVKYIALMPVSGTAPQGNHSDFWSTLALIGQGPVDPFAALEAEIEAVNEIAVSGSNLAWSLYVGGGNYLINGTATVACHNLNWGTNSDQVNAAQMPYLAGGSTYPTVEAALEALFYVPLRITSFTNDVGTVETGRTINSVDLAWAFNKAVVSQSLSQGIGALPIGQRNYTDSGAWTSNRTYTLSASDGTTSANGNTSITFSTKNYWGVSATPSPLTSAEVIALNSQFASSRNQSVTLSPAAQYVYFCYPSSFGTATFTVNGLLNTAWVLTVISFTNASGYTSNYNLYQSTNLLTGTYQIVVS